MSALENTIVSDDTHFWLGEDRCCDEMVGDMCSEALEKETSPAFGRTLALKDQPSFGFCSVLPKYD